MRTIVVGIVVVAISLCGRLLLAQAPLITIAVDGPAITISLTTAQLQALQATLARRSIASVPGEQAMTLNQWIGAVIRDRLRELTQEQLNLDISTACATFATLPPNDQQLILDKLSGKSPCVR